jgi:hypothetical protein
MFTTFVNLCQKFGPIGPPWPIFTLSTHVVHWESIKLVHTCCPLGVHFTRIIRLYQFFNFFMLLLSLNYSYELKFESRNSFFILRIRLRLPASTSTTTSLIPFTRLVWWPCFCRLRLRLRTRGLICAKQVHKYVRCTRSWLSAVRLLCVCGTLVNFALSDKTFCACTYANV